MSIEEKSQKNKFLFEVKEILEQHHVYIDDRYLKCQARFLLKFNQILKKYSSYIRRDYFLTKITFLCLFPFMNSNSPEIRSENLKIIRLLLNEKMDWKILMQLRYDIYFIRSLYQYNINEDECRYIIAILGKALKICPQLFPHSIINCLYCLVCDPNDWEKNSVKVSVLGIFTHFSLRFPKCFSTNNVIGALLNLSLQSFSNPQLVESFISILLHLFDCESLSNYVCPDTVVESLLAPFTNQTYICSLSIEDDAENVHKMCRSSSVALRVLFRSWNGLTFLFSNNKGISSLFQILPHTSPTIQGLILNLIYDMFLIEYPDDLPDFLKVLSNLKPSIKQKRATYFDNVDIVEEYLTFLQPKYTNSVELINIFKAYLTSISISSGIIESLMQTIISTKERYIKYTSLIILGEILYLYHTLVPGDGKQCERFQVVISRYMTEFGEKSIEIKYIMAHLDSFVKWKNEKNTYPCISPISLCIVKRNSIEPENKINDQRKMEERGDSQYRINDTPELVKHIAACRITSNSSDLWSWDKIQKIFIKYPFILVDKNQDQTTYKFMVILRNFFFPTRNSFFSIKISSSIAKIASDVIVLFFKCLLHPLQSTEGLNWIEEFLSLFSKILETRILFEQPNQSNDLKQSKTYLSFSDLTNSIQDCLCKQYFMIVGLIQGYDIGQAYIKKSPLFLNIYKILENSPDYQFVKAVIPCLDYKNSLCQQFFASIFNSSDSKSKIYCIKFAKTLPRFDTIPMFIVNELIKMLFDCDSQVKDETADALDEILDGNVEACYNVLSINPPFLSLNYNGIKLLTRLISTVKLFKISENLLEQHFESLSKAWTSNALVHYAADLERKINTSFSCYGTYSSKDCVTVISTSLDPLPVCQIYLRTYKIHKFIKNEHLSEMCQYLIQTNSKNTDETLHKLLFFANYCSTTKGVKIILKNFEYVFENIVNIAYNSEVASLRWISVIVLNIIGKTKAGPNIMDQFRWRVAKKISSLQNNQDDEYTIKLDQQLVTIISHSMKHNGLDGDNMSEFSTNKEKSKASEGKNKKLFYSSSLRIPERSNNLSCSIYDNVDLNINRFRTFQQNRVIRENSKDYVNASPDDTFSIESMTDDRVTKGCIKSTNWPNCCYNSPFRQLEQISSESVCLPPDIDNIFKLPVNLIYTSSQIIKYNPLHTFGEETINETNDTKHKCIICSASKLCENGCHESILISCINIDEYQNYDKNTFIGINNDLDISNRQIQLDMMKGIKAVKKDVISILFNMISNSTISTATKHVSDIKKKWPQIFTDGCLMSYICDEATGHSFNLTNCRYIYEIFEWANWNSYLTIAANAINIYLIEQKDILI